MPIALNELEKGIPQGYSFKRPSKNSQTAFVYQGLSGAGNDPVITINVDPQGYATMIGYASGNALANKKHKPTFQALRKIIDSGEIKKIGGQQ